jgi:4-azaleucine resistance transporter AzlC
MSALVFAGASQFMAASMILSGVGGIQIVIATLFINLRHSVMSMAVHHTVQKTSGIWRSLLSFGVTDETFALLTLQDSEEHVQHTHFFAIGLIGIAYAGWVTGTAIGSFGAQIIPPSIGDAMTIGLYAMFIGLLMPHIRRSVRIVLVALVSMMLNAALSTIISAGWAIVIATILGASFGLFIGASET